MSNAFVIHAQRASLVGLLSASIGCGGSDPQPSETLAREIESLQCRPQSVTVTQLNQELAAHAIDVKSSSCAWDGLGRTAACDTPIAFIRVIEVPQNQVERAMALGYRPVSSFRTVLPIECPQP